MDCEYNRRPTNSVIIPFQLGFFLSFFNYLNYNIVPCFYSDLYDYNSSYFCCINIITVICITGLNLSCGLLCWSSQQTTAGQKYNIKPKIHWHPKANRRQKKNIRHPYRVSKRAQMSTPGLQNQVICYCSTNTQKQ